MVPKKGFVSALKTQAAENQYDTHNNPYLCGVQAYSMRAFLLLGLEMLEPTIDELRMHGRIINVSQSASGNTTFVIRVKHAPPFLKRNRFFGHIHECLTPYPDLERRDWMTFSPKPPLKAGQLPRAVNIVRIRKADAPHHLSGCGQEPRNFEKE